MKILSVIGTRPQYVKASAIFHEMKNYPQIESVLVDSGQHYDANLSDIFLEELGIPRPDYNLKVGSQSHAKMTAGIMSGVDEIIDKEKPDWVLVYGDTNTTLGAALTAVKLNIPVAHIEAGVRVGNRRMPEEINRILTDHASTLLFVPTEGGIAQLAKEGIIGARVVYSGDVMYDVAVRFKALAQARTTLLDTLGLRDTPFILSTIHRAENTDDIDRLRAIVEAFVTLSETIRIVLPLHPRTRNALRKAGLFDQLNKAITLTEPVGYLDMAALASQATLIATDSGGLQREAFFYHVPCVNIHTDTFWPELETAGWNHVAKTVDRPTIIGLIQRVLRAGAPAQWVNPFGGENNAKTILEAIIQHADSKTMSDKAA